MFRLYANENFPFPAVGKLRQFGYNILTSQEAGNAGQAVADEDVLKFAVRTDRAVITLNRRHFVRLHTKFGPHAGIVVCSYDPDSERLAQRVHEALQAIQDLKGQLIRVNRS